MGYANDGISRIEADFSGLTHENCIFSFVQNKLIISSRLGFVSAKRGRFRAYCVRKVSLMCEERDPYNSCRMFFDGLSVN